MAEIFKKIKRAVVVDDNLMDRTFLKSMLSIHNIAEDVVAFDCPYQAISFLESSENEKNTCIFLDINMPGLNGFDFLDKMNELIEVNEKKKPSVVLVTSSDCPDDIKKSSLYDNVVGYLIKPINQVDFQKLKI